MIFPISTLPNPSNIITISKFIKNSNRLEIELPIITNNIGYDYEYIFIKDLKKGFLKFIDKNRFIYIYTSDKKKDIEIIKYKFLIKYRGLSYNSSFSNIEIIIN